VQTAVTVVAVPETETEPVTDAGHTGPVVPVVLPVVVAEPVPVVAEAVGAPLLEVLTG